MERRALLKRVAGVPIAGGLAGCLSSPGAGSKDPNDTTDPTTDGPGPVLEELTVGSRDGVAFPDNHLPHELEVVNAAAETREVGLRLTTSDDRTMVDRTWSMPADGRVQIRLLEPDKYSLAVRLAESTVGTVPIARGFFDCNQSRTTVDITPDQALETSTLSTLLACPDPEVTETELSVTGSGCADQEDGAATVGRGDEALTLAGTIRVPNPCYGASLESVTYKERPEDTLTVRVAQSEPAGNQVCVECVGAIEYEGTISLAHDYPETVVVEHAHFDRVDEVARVQIDE